MINYNKFCTDRYEIVTMEMRETTIQMWKSITEFMLSDKWCARELCSDWIAKWENILFCLQENEYICQPDYNEFAEYAIRRIIEICKTFGCDDLYEKYLVD